MVIPLGVAVGLPGRVRAFVRPGRFPHQLEEAVSIVAENPETKFILNHGGYLLPDEADLRTVWRRGRALLARHDNVVVKISSDASVDPAVSNQGLRSFVDDIFSAFGPGRAMFASNFPVDGRYTSYADLSLLMSR